MRATKPSTIARLTALHRSLPPIIAVKDVMAMSQAQFEEYRKQILEAKRELDSIIHEEQS